MSEHEFNTKWGEILRNAKGDEFTLFVPPRTKPKTQRQFNLYSYWQFIHNLIKDKHYTIGAEFGCGRGTISLFLTAYDGLKMKLIDNAPDGIQLAKDNFKMFGTAGEFILADAAATGLPDASVDLVVSIGLLEHIPDYRTVLREKYRILRPGGIMISLNIPKKTSVQILNTWYQKLFKPAGARKSDYYRNEDTPAQYVTATKEVGFSDVFYYNANPFPIFTPVPSLVERGLTYLYRGIMAIRAIYKKYSMATSYGLSQGHFVVGYKK